MRPLTRARGIVGTHLNTLTFVRACAQAEPNLLPDGHSSGYQGEMRPAIRALYDSPGPVRRIHLPRQRRIVALIH